MTPTIEYWDRRHGGAVDSNDSRHAVIGATFADGDRLQIAVADSTPDEDGAISYTYDIVAPGRVTCRAAALESGRDGRIDLLRALRDLVDMILDLSQEDERPTSLGVAVDAWVDRHWDELDELFGHLHSVVAA